MLVAALDATTVEPRHYGHILLANGVIDIELAALLSVCIGGRCVRDVIHLLILLTLCL
jgi:hypothetical protein